MRAPLAGGIHLFLILARYVGIWRARSANGGRPALRAGARGSSDQDLSTVGMAHTRIAVAER